MVSREEVITAEKKEFVRAYIAAFRPDYWFKNVFTVTGIVGAVLYFGIDLAPGHLPRMALALLLSCLISSVGYVINEVLDASFDALHPVKKYRPIPSGKVSVDILLLLNTGLLLLTMSMSVLFFRPVFSILLMLYLVSAALYNMPPIRLKDRPFLDITNESSSSPIRFLIGWYSFGEASEFPPVLALLLLWIFGAYILTGKRLAECRFLGQDAAKYRASFRYYSERTLVCTFAACALVSILLFAFLAYARRPPVLYSVPLVAVCFIWFSILTYKKDSIVQQPESMIRKWLFAGTCLITLILIIYLLL